VLAQEGGEGSPLWHLNNIVSTFDALKDVFEKQTKSPSIKSCYDLRELMRHGVFVVRLGKTSAQSLVVRMANTQAEHDAEYLLDLRSKLLMAEIPAELEAEFGASAMIDAFVAQLQVMTDTADALRLLFDDGHADFQAAYVHERPLAMDGLGAASLELKDLQATAYRWQRRVKESRDRFFFLNYYTMREVLKIREIVLTGTAADATPEAPSAGDDGAAGESAIQLCQRLHLYRGPAFLEPLPDFGDNVRSS